MTRPRPVRADTERTITAILEAAEEVLSRDPAATMEQISQAAGVARTTVHRRFATREALIESLAVWGIRRFAAALHDARPDTAPPLVALYQTTANALSAKSGWGFAMSHVSANSPEVAPILGEVQDTCDRMFRRAKEAGVLRPDADVTWTRRVYYALINEAAQDIGEKDTDELATLVVETLLRGVGSPHPGRL